MEDFEWGVSYAAEPNVLRDFNMCVFPLQEFTGEQFAPPQYHRSRRPRRGGVRFTDRLRASVEARQTWETKEERAVSYPARQPRGPVLKETFEYFFAALHRGLQARA